MVYVSWANVLHAVVTNSCTVAESNLPPIAVNAIVIGIVGFNVLTALNPASPTFSSSNQADVKKRPSGPIQNPKINPISDPQAFLGIDKGFGFTRKNELFVGRMAMIGFASAIIGVSLPLCISLMSKLLSCF